MDSCHNPLSVCLLQMVVKRLKVRELLWGGTDTELLSSLLCSVNSPHDTIVVLHVVLRGTAAVIMLNQDFQRVHVPK